jgi:hypothetical protein
VTSSAAAPSDRVATAISDRLAVSTASTAAGSAGCSLATFGIPNPVHQSIFVSCNNYTLPLLPGGDTARIPRLPGVARIGSSRMTQHARAGPGHRAFRWTNARTTVVRENSRTPASSTPSSPERRQDPRRAAWCPASGRRPAGSRRPPRRWSRLARRKNARVHRPAARTGRSSAGNEHHVGPAGASGSRVAPARRQSDVAHANSCVNQ